jgi:hypothetical protein
MASCSGCRRGIFGLCCLLAAFSFRAGAMPAEAVLNKDWHYWCGDLIEIKGIDDVETYLSMAFPFYFSSARHVNPDGTLVGLAIFQRTAIGTPSLLLVSPNKDLIMREEFRPLEDVSHPSWRVDLSVEPLALADRRRMIAVRFSDGAALVSEDYRYLVLCRPPLDPEFEYLSSFLKSTKIKLDEVVNFARGCELHLLSSSKLLH